MKARLTQTGRCLLAATLLGILAHPTHAGWKKMDAQYLSGLKLNYGDGWQDFRPTGRTLYNAGEDSWGYWREDDGQYCSQWPPREDWTCYGVERNGNNIRFTDQSGHKTVGRIE